MVKSCCAVGCSNRYNRESSLNFYRFPKDTVRRNKWIAAVRRKKWKPTQHSWICSAHFLSGQRSDDPLSSDFVPTLFSYVDSSKKKRLQRALQRYERRKAITEKRDAVSDVSTSMEISTCTSNDTEAVLEPDVSGTCTTEAVLESGVSSCHQYQLQ